MSVRNHSGDKRALLSFLAATILLGGSAVACNTILGAGEFRIGAGDGSMPIGTDGGGGTGGDGASTPDGGGPVLVDSGNPEIGGDGGPGPTSCSPNNLPLDASAFITRVNQCLLWAGCDPDAPSPDDCLTEDIFAMATYGGCLTNPDVKTCADVTNCTGRSYLPPTTPQCAATANDDYGTVVCEDGGIAIQCANGSADLSTFMVDCKSRGGKCASYVDTGFSSSDPSDVQMLAGCTIPSAGCGASSDPYGACLGNNAVAACVADASIGVDCTTYGAGGLCEVDFNGNPGCLAPVDGGTCSSSTPPTCLNSSIALECNPGGYIAQINCAAAGLECVAGQGCMAPGCTSSADVSACNNNEGCSSSPSETTLLTLCIGGALVTIDCTTINPTWSCQTFGDYVNVGFCAPALP